MGQPPAPLAPGATLRPPRRPLTREDLRALPLDPQDDEPPLWASVTIAACTYAAYACIWAFVGFCAAYLFD